MRIAHNRWEPTESTIGAWASHFRLPSRAAEANEGIDREIWLGDFGGQADQRLVHQLYMGDTSLAVLVFDGQKDDVMPRLWEWNRALDSAQRGVPKILVAGRTDTNSVRLSRVQLDEFCNAAGYAAYLETSAKTKAGCNEFREAIAASIDWTMVPWRTSSVVFKRLKTAILDLKDTGRVLTSTKELRDWLPAQIGPFEPAQLDAVVGLLAGPGAILPLEFGDYILLRPELINTYGQSSRAFVAIPRSEAVSPRSASCAASSTTPLTSYGCLKPMSASSCTPCTNGWSSDRSACATTIRREAAHHAGVPQLLPARTPGSSDPAPLLHDLPVQRPPRRGVHDPRRTAPPHRAVRQLRAVAQADFTTATGSQIGMRLIPQPDGTGTLDVYCDPGGPTSEQVLFARYVHEHLKNNASDVTRLRTYICPACSTPVENRDAARRRLLDGKPDIACSYCEERITLRDVIERKLASLDVGSRVEEMRVESQVVLDAESRERLLVGEVYAMAARANQIAREITVSDQGIDMEIEFKNDDGNATGKKLYLYLESDDSHLRRRQRDDRRVFRIKNPRHADYWVDQGFPVMLVIRDSSGAIEWMEIAPHLRGPARRREVAGDRDHLHR